MTDKKTLEKLASLEKINALFIFRDEKYNPIEKAEITSDQGVKILVYVAGILKSDSLVCSDKLSSEGFLSDPHPFSIRSIKDYQPLK